MDVFCVAVVLVDYLISLIFFFVCLCFCGFLVVEVVVMGFFSTRSGGFFVTEVVVMGG